MTDKTFTFTIDQIKDIYRAGIRCGEEEASAYDWGSSTLGREFDNCIDAIHDIINEGKDWEDEGYTDWNTIYEWFK
jgi:hypothetical protein